MKQRGVFLLLAMLVFGLFSIGQLFAQSPAVVTLVKAGRLLDPRTGNVVSPAAVRIENARLRRLALRRKCKRMHRLVSALSIWAVPPCCLG